MLSAEYLESVLETAKQYLPDWLMAELHKAALPSAGGRARHRQEEPTCLEKMALSEMRSGKLREASDNEVVMAWLRLHQWFAAAQRRREVMEPIVNAAVWVMEELERRGLGYDHEDELVRQAAKIGKEASPLDEKLAGLPDEVLLTKDFVSVVGSAAEGKQEAEDIDVLFRANRDKEGDNYLIQADNVWLPVRKALDPGKRGNLHFIDSPQGSHADYIPLYSLVLRREQPVKQVVKESEGGVSPGRRFEVEKPLMAGTVEYFSTEELWPWVDKKLAAGARLGGEIKYDGFRCVLSWDGKAAQVWFEDAKEDRARSLPDLVDACKHSGLSSFVLDGEMLATHKGKLLPRTQLIELIRGGFHYDPLYYVFDCLYYENQDISGEPLEVRRGYAAKVTEALGKWCKMSRSVGIGDKRELEIVGKWAASQPGSEGLMVKDLGKAYTFGGSDDWAKLKTVVELKVAVLEVEKIEAGYTYRCGLLAAGPYSNRMDIDGKAFVDLGKTFATREKMAAEGDTLNVRVEELLILASKQGPELAWGKPTVVGPDRSRGPYSAVQAVDIARRGHVLKQEVAKADVPTWVGREVRVAFVGASPSQLEAALGEPMRGPVGEVFKERYLVPLGLGREQVMLANLVPDLLLDGEGRVREPNEAEIARWRGWLVKEMDQAAPGLVIALGRTARQALDGRADFMLPHPAALRHLGDSGELDRKLRQVKKALEEVDTHSEAAEKFWQENWYKLYPPGGKGSFVYHHHYRGLTEDETKLDEKELLARGRSVHGDLRCEGAEGLWGFTVFLGTADAVARAGGDRLVGLAPDDNLQGAFKQGQPAEWLKVGIPDPYVAEPGNAGATSDKYAKFFAYDHGTYQMGTWREHMIEVFLAGERLKGRYQLNYAPVGGRRIWLIDRPIDQTPYAESHDLSSITEELKGRGQRWLVWAKPGVRPQLIDVASGQAVSYEAKIFKADPVRQIVYGVVLEPDTEDTQGDVMAADEIEAAAHRFLVRSRVIGERHRGKAHAEVVESYLAPADFEIGGDGPQVRKGSWVLGVHVIDSDLWQKIENGEYNSFSVGGFGLREEVSA